MSSGRLVMMHAAPLRKECVRIFSEWKEPLPVQAKEQDRNECKEMWNEHLVDLVIFYFLVAVVLADAAQRILLMETSSDNGD